jgi:NAD(P)-dependent dehydrogenase (short-subunit alcohol dehydrogenase family)
MPWTAADIPDLHGRVAVVTGASGGVGYATAVELARHGARVIVASRNEERTQEAALRIAAETPGASVDARLLDLASLSSVRRFADGLAREHSAIDILVNNAGVSGGPRRVTVEGFEVHFQVNYLGHFALVALLLPLLRARSGARVVSISSDVASRGHIDFDDLQSVRAYDLVKAYAQSKLANLLFAFELQRRAGDTGVASFAAHPGVASSNLLVGREADWGRPRRGLEHVLRFVQLLLAQPAALGALPALYQATDPSARPEEYVGPRGLLHGRGYPGRTKIPIRALDEDVAMRLWDISARLSGVAPELDSTRRPS